MEESKRNKIKRVEKEWRRQEIWEIRREENRQRAMEKRKCFVCRNFRYITCYCRNVGEEGLAQISLNKSEVLKDRVMQKGEKRGREAVKDRREILREERARRGVEVRQTKVEREEKKLREVTMKIGLKYEEEEKRIIVDALLDSGAIGLMMSKEFTRKHRFRRMKLERPIYVRNVDGTLNYMGPIEDIVEIEIYFKRHKEKTSIDVIGGQK